MHIGFDISQTGRDKAGCGFFAHSILHNLLQLAPEHRYSLFPSFGDFYFNRFMPLRNPYPGVNVKYGPWYMRHKSAQQFWNAAGLEQAIGHPDVVQSNNFWCPTTLQQSRLIYTVHDLSFLVNPSWTTETNRLGCFDGVFRSAQVADWIVATSEATRQHYLATFPHYPADRVKVIYQCSRFNNTDEPGKKPKILQDIGKDEFWLSVGTLEPRKNQRQLVEAYARYLARGNKALKLVLAGRDGWLMDDFQTFLNERGLADQVIITGYVSDKELIWLYKHCFANLYPSFFEGFGLPVLEGMQFGAPTLASKATSIPEIAGDAAMLLDPNDIDAWALAMEHLQHDEQKRHALRAKAVLQAAHFSGEQSAKAFLKLYQQASSTPKRKPQ